MDEKNFKNIKFKCNKCENVSNSSELTSHTEAFGDEQLYSWILVKCSFCPEVNLLGYDHLIPLDYVDALDVLYPLKSKTIEGLPPDVEKAYKEALKVRNSSSNAFAVMLRKVLEIVCKEQGATGGNLKQKINNLATNQNLPKQLVDIAHNSRLLGNAGIHNAEGLSDAEIPILEVLCNTVLEYIYGIPALVTKVKERIEELELQEPEKNQKKSKEVL